MAQTVLAVAGALIVAVAVLYLVLAEHWRTQDRRRRSAPDDATYEAQQRANRSQQTPESHP